MPRYQLLAWVKLNDTVQKDSKCNSDPQVSNEYKKYDNIISWSSIQWQYISRIANGVFRIVKFNLFITQLLETKHQHYRNSSNFELELM